jgi:MoaA/NifB/PqqE/SkfB family radical SAM enzyme
LLEDGIPIACPQHATLRYTLGGVANRDFELVKGVNSMHMNDLAALKAANRNQMRLEFASGRVELAASPRILFVELARHCNLACQMCREPGQIGKETRMSEALFERIADELFPTAEIVDLRGWGESLILPEWPERLAAAISHGCDVRIVTNLSYSKPHVLESLVKAKAWVGVSLDGATQEVLNATRRGADLALIQENLQYLGTAYRSAGIADRLRLDVTCQRPNLATLEDMIDIAARCGFPLVSLGPVFAAPTNLVNINGMNGQLKDALNRASRRAAEKQVTLVQTANLWEGQSVKDAEGPCCHPWSHCYITYNGGVGFCDHLIGTHCDPFLIGHLDSASFRSIWNSPEWQELRREHLGERRADKPFFEECAWCYRNRYTDIEDLLEPALVANRKYLHRASGQQ